MADGGDMKYSAGVAFYSGTYSGCAAGMTSLIWPRKSGQHVARRDEGIKASWWWDIDNLLSISAAFKTQLMFRARTAIGGWRVWKTGHGDGYRETLSSYGM